MGNLEPRPWYLKASRRLLAHRFPSLVPLAMQLPLILLISTNVPAKAVAPASLAPFADSAAPGAGVSPEEME
jgi:hypothetical protein